MVGGCAKGRAMISRIQIKNYKCLLDVDVPLGPFNIFIGPNDSGKSSLLEAIKVLGQTARQPFNQVFAEPLTLENLVWRREQNREVSWKVEGAASDSPFSYQLALAPGRQSTCGEELIIGGQRILKVVRQNEKLEAVVLPDLPGGQQFGLQPGFSGLFSLFGSPHNQALLYANPQARGKLPDVHPIIESLSASVEYRLDPPAIRNSGSDPTQHPFAQNAALPVPVSPILSTTGDNLIAVLDAIMTSPRRTNILNLENDLHSAINTLKGISLPVRPPNAKTLSFTLNGDETEPVTIPAALASDGALLITAFLALAYGNTPEIIFIEEPENGLHYSLLKLAVEVLRKISTGKAGNRPRQVILTTHSPLLLNFAKPEEVRVFSRPDDGATRISQMEKVPNLKVLLEEFGLGELWFQLGEERLMAEAAP
jgi:predicted ATPase